MRTLGKTVGRKAAKATVRHSARGLASKARRKPFRSISLLSAGMCVGLALGWIVGRKTAPRPESEGLS